MCFIPAKFIAYSFGVSVLWHLGADSVTSLVSACRSSNSTPIRPISPQCCGTGGELPYRMDTCIRVCVYIYIWSLSITYCNPQAWTGHCFRFSPSEWCTVRRSYQWNKDTSKSRTKFWAETGTISRYVPQLPQFPTVSMCLFTMSCVQEQHFHGLPHNLPGVLESPKSPVWRCPFSSQLFECHTKLYVWVRTAGQATVKRCQARASLHFESEGH